MPAESHPTRKPYRSSPTRKPYRCPTGGDESLAELSPSADSIPYQGRASHPTPYRETHRVSVGRASLSDLLIPTKSNDDDTERSGVEVEHRGVDRDHVPGSASASTASAVEGGRVNASAVGAHVGSLPGSPERIGSVIDRVLEALSKGRDT